jgi:hypothetical protein
VSEYHFVLFNMDESRFLEGYKVAGRVLYWTPHITSALALTEFPSDLAGIVGDMDHITRLFIEPKLEDRLRRSEA